MVFSYGLFLAAALLVGVAITLYRIKKEKLPVEPYVDLLLLIIGTAALGARLGYILEFPQEFPSWKTWGNPLYGGFSFFAGLFFVAPVYYFFLRWRKIPFWQTSDFLVPTLPLALALMRIGCFSAGCCYGTPTQLFWGASSPLAPNSQLPLHPIQIYESIFLLGLTAFLFFKRFSMAGEKTLLFLGAYSLFRWLSYPLRGDFIYWEKRVDPSLLAAILLFWLSLGIWIWKKKLLNRRQQ